MLFGDFLNPGNCFKLALVPVPGTIRLPESAEFRRKATLFRRIAVLVQWKEAPRPVCDGRSSTSMKSQVGAHLK